MYLSRASRAGWMSDHTTITREIAEDVYKTLGSGFSEDVYDRAMQVGLRLAKIGYEGQKVAELKYKEHYVGEGYPDLVVHLGNEKLIVELKAIRWRIGCLRGTATPQLHDNSECPAGDAH
jgi:GxxExxY protein